MQDSLKSAVRVGNANDSAVPMAEPMVAQQVSFRLPASDAIGASEESRALSRIFEAFAPSTPVTNIEHFAGRARQLKLLVSAIEEHRNHIVLYGPPSRGKTSLAMALLSIASRASYRTFYISCGHQSTLESLFRPVLSSLTRRFDSLLDLDHEKSGSSQTFLDLLSDGVFTPQTVGQALARITGTRLLVAIDDADKIETPSLTRELADLMKILSDNSAAVHLILVGVGRDLEHLLGKEPTQLRPIFSMSVGLMSNEEIAELLVVLSRVAGIQMTRNVMARIVGIARGKPFVARLVALQAAKAAALRGVQVVDDVDMTEALDALAEHLDAAGFGRIKPILAKIPEVKPLLDIILQGARDSSDVFTVQQIASRLGDPDGSGAQAVAVERALKTLVGGSANVLEEVEGEGTRQYRFVDPRVELYARIVCGYGQRARPGPASST